MTADFRGLGSAAYPSPPSFSSPSHQPSSVSSLHGRSAMSSSMSPDPGPSSIYGGAPSGSQDRGGSSSANLGFLKNLTEKRTTRDGQPAKRRGPKPDSKPALTRRQELNRQAQRTHRERKELYIKALEDEVLRLKEIYSNVSQDKDKLAQENRHLKSLLSQSGLGGGLGGGSGNMAGGSSVLDDASAGYTSSPSVTGSYAQAPSSNTSAFTPPQSATNMGQPHAVAHSHSASHHQQYHRRHAPGQSGQGHNPGGSGVAGGRPDRNPPMDFDQSGIDFVLTLERPCMDHMPWLLERGTETGGGEPCGHALMASCPPEPFPELTPDIPFGYSNVRVPGGPPGHGGGGTAETAQRTWELSKADLSTLLDLSKRLNLDGEITPVMAWGMVLAHPRLSELSSEDLARMAEELGGKVRCYGFGAVMEEFEVRDALENIFSTKPEYGIGY
ncbi:putative bzip-type transcription factor protein [Podospora conica]|nr:putative bzip-type transcription factor protein [Schizothecium conicum]